MGAPRPQPVITRASIVSTIAGLLSLLVSLGLLPAATAHDLSDQAEVVIAAGGVLFTTVPTMLHAVLAARHVTPTADPRDNAGNKLVPEGSAQTEPSAAAALEAAEAVFATSAPQHLSTA